MDRRVADLFQQVKTWAKREASGRMVAMRQWLIIRAVDGLPADRVYMVQSMGTSPPMVSP